MASRLSRKGVEGGSRTGAGARVGVWGHRLGPSRAARPGPACRPTGACIAPVDKGLPSPPYAPGPPAPTTNFPRAPTRPGCPADAPQDLLATLFARHRHAYIRPRQLDWGGGVRARPACGSTVACVAPLARVPCQRAPALRHGHAQQHQLVARGHYGGRALGMGGRIWGGGRGMGAGPGRRLRTPKPRRRGATRPPGATAEPTDQDKVEEDAHGEAAGRPPPRRRVCVPWASTAGTPTPAARQPGAARSHRPATPHPAPVPTPPSAVVRVQKVEQRAPPRVGREVGVRLVHFQPDALPRHRGVEVLRGGGKGSDG